jgi:hypothetical protein
MTGGAALGMLVDPLSPDDGRDMPTSTVQVCADHRGGWEIELPDRDDHVFCATLHEARALAFRLARQMPPCDLVVRDAYDRVLQHELIETSSIR